jgi:squalene-hopene/tetraprenyl-beta-curcumene cyclase
MAMDRARRAGADSRYDQAIDRAADWIKVCKANGGWAAFDVDNVYDYLNNIPFADHGAFIDPPTEDVTARCVSMLAQIGETLGRSESLSRGVDYLLSTQMPDGSWYGRWGLNYIYGTWSALCALNACGTDQASAEIRKAVRGSFPFKIPTEVGAKMGQATNWTIAVTSRLPVPRHRRHGSPGLMFVGRLTIRQ